MGRLSGGVQQFALTAASKLHIPVGMRRGGPGGEGSEVVEEDILMIMMPCVDDFEPDVSSVCSQGGLGTWNEMGAKEMGGCETWMGKDGNRILLYQSMGDSSWSVCSTPHAVD